MTKTGRPTTFTSSTLQKLEEVFALGGSDKEACFYASLSPSSLYNYQAKHPEFLERKELLKEQPVLKARRSVIAAMEKDARLALMYLERKKHDEFQPKTVSRSEVVERPAPLGDSESEGTLNTLRQEYEIKLRELYTAPA
jgi:hypothetical protein